MEMEERVESLSSNGDVMCVEWSIGDADDLLLSLCDSSLLYIPSATRQDIGWHDLPQLSWIYVDWSEPYELGALIENKLVY